MVAGAENPVRAVTLSGPALLGGWRLMFADPSGLG